MDLSPSESALKAHQPELYDLSSSVRQDLDIYSQTTPSAGDWYTDLGLWIGALMMS